MHWCLTHLLMPWTSYEDFSNLILTNESLQSRLSNTLMCHGRQLMFIQSSFSLSFSLLSSSLSLPSLYLSSCKSARNIQSSSQVYRSGRVIDNFPVSVRRLSCYLWYQSPEVAANHLISSLVTEGSNIVRMTYTRTWRIWMREFPLPPPSLPLSLPPSLPPSLYLNSQLPHTHHPTTRHSNK